MCACAVIPSTKLTLNGFGKFVEYYCCQTDIQAVTTPKTPPKYGVDIPSTNVLLQMYCFDVLMFTSVTVGV